jgi:hypothetical protein
LSGVPSNSSSPESFCRSTYRSLCNHLANFYKMLISIEKRSLA